MQPALLQHPDWDTRNLLWEDRRGVTWQSELRALQRIILAEPWLNNVWRDIFLWAV